MTTWLKHLVAAYCPVYLRGMLLNGPYRLGAARMRECAASDHGTPVPPLAPPPRVDIDTMFVPPTRLKPTP